MYQVSVTVVVQSPSCHAILECSGLVLHVYKALFRLCVLSLLYCCCTELHIIPANVVESRSRLDYTRDNSRAGNSTSHNTLASKKRV